MIEKESVKELSSIQAQDQGPLKRHDTCVILHLYHPDIWDEIRSYLSNLGNQFDLFVTIPYEVDISEDGIQAHFPHAQIYRCENRGRNIAPFLGIFSAISELNYRYLCKIHTKKSVYISTGKEWQRDMMEKLLGTPETVVTIKRAFDQHADWGIIGPYGHVVPHTFYWTQNAENVVRLAKSLDIPTEAIEFSYVAGSMFWFRPEALSLILRLGFRTEDFEPEQGKIDGTLAHAIERCFGMFANHTGYKIAESSSNDVKLPDIPFQFGLLIQAFQQREQTFSTELVSLNEKLRRVSEQVSTLKREVSELTRRVSNKEWELSEIYRSKAWRLILVLRSLRLRMIPPGSTRERVLFWGIQGARILRDGNFRLLLSKVVGKFKQSTRARHIHSAHRDMNS